MQIPEQFQTYLEEYARLIASASYHYADDSGREWDLAMAAEAKAEELRRHALGQAEEQGLDLTQEFLRVMARKHIRYLQGFPVDH